MNRPEESNFTCYAFVSYSHEDQKWAEWIQHAMSMKSFTNTKQERKKNDDSTGIA